MKFIFNNSITTAFPQFRMQPPSSGPTVWLLRFCTEWKHGKSDELCFLCKKRRVITMIFRVCFSSAKTIFFFLQVVPIIFIMFLQCCLLIQVISNANNNFLREIKPTIARPLNVNCFCTYCIFDSTDEISLRIRTDLTLNIH